VSDKITLKGMRFFGYHGVFPEEAKLGQSFIVDVELYADLRAAGETDELSRTINYAAVYAAVKEIVEGHPFRLIEAVAERVAGRILEAFRVREVVVRVHKPNAPIPGPIDCVTVEIRRSRA
jgi:dihydroneopterin aldolase